MLEALVAAAVEGVCYWRDKAQREVDFIVRGARGAVDAIECKWSASAFSARGLEAFRALHPKGRNFLVAASAEGAHRRAFGGLEVEVLGLGELVTRLRRAE